MQNVTFKVLIKYCAFFLLWHPPGSHNTALFIWDGLVWAEENGGMCFFMSLFYKNGYAITVLLFVQGSAVFYCFFFSFLGGLEQQASWFTQPYWALWFNTRWPFRSVVFMVIILWWTLHLHFKTNASSLSCTAKELPNSTKPSTAQKRNLKKKRTVNDHRGKKI